MLDLLGGLLDEGEAQEAIDHLQRCAACHESFRRLAGDAERFKVALRGPRPAKERESALSRRPARGRLDRPIAVPESTPRPAGWSPRRQRAGAIVLASACIVAVAVVIANRRRSAESVTASVPWLPDVTELVQWRDAGPEEHERILVEGLRAYSRRDMKTTTELLARYPMTGQLEALRLVYLSSATAHQGKWKESLRHLSALPADAIPDPWRTEVQWTRYLALRRTGSVASADSLLSAFSRSGGELSRRAQASREARPRKSTS